MKTGTKFEFQCGPDQCKVETTCETEFFVSPGDIIPENAHHLTGSALVDWYYVGDTKPVWL